MPVNKVLEIKCDGRNCFKFINVPNAEYPQDWIIIFHMRMTKGGVSVIDFNAENLLGFCSYECMMSYFRHKMSNFLVEDSK